MSDEVFWIVAGVLVILCAGEPDLLDSTIKYVDSLENNNLCNSPS